MRPSLGQQMSDLFMRKLFTWGGGGGGGGVLYQQKPIILV